MGESVIYSSIVSCILASMASIKTRIVAFDTNIVDLTEKSENPSKTLFFLISDLEEGGKPYYDAQMAQKIAGLSIPCFACNPQMLPTLLERALKGQDLAQFEKEFSKRGKTTG